MKAIIQQSKTLAKTPIVAALTLHGCPPRACCPLPCAPAPLVVSLGAIYGQKLACACMREPEI